MTFQDMNAGTYTKRLDYDGGGNVSYSGEAIPGTLSSAASWAIRRYTYVGGNVTLIEWAGGNNLMASVWDNRVVLAYS